MSKKEGKEKLIDTRAKFGELLDALVDKSLQDDSLMSDMTDS